MLLRVLIAVRCELAAFLKPFLCQPRKDKRKLRSIPCLDAHVLRARSREFLSLPNCAVEVLIHARRHGLVVLISNVFAYHLRVQEAVTANAAMPLVAGEDVRTPPGTFRIVFRVGHSNKSCI